MRLEACVFGSPRSSDCFGRVSFVIFSALGEDGSLGRYGLE